MAAKRTLRKVPAEEGGDAEGERVAVNSDEEAERYGSLAEPDDPRGRQKPDLSPGADELHPRVSSIPDPCGTTGFLDARHGPDGAWPTPTYAEPH